MNQRKAPQPGKLPDKPTLSVCMIVRDEEKVLPRCLQSVREIADELIVVDTGSEDKTVSIAKSFNAQVFSFQWCDDFSAARNKYLEHATCDWILHMDADEELPSESIVPLSRAMSNPWCFVYFITCDEGPKHPHRFRSIARLFRNHPLVSYSRPYHEVILPSVDKLREKEPKWEIQYHKEIMIRHHGGEESDSPEKYKKALKILKSYVEKHPQDSDALTHLGHVYYCLGQYDEAKAHFKRALGIRPGLSEANYFLGLMFYEEGRVEEAIWCYKKAIENNPFMVEPHADLGAIYVDKGMPERAIPMLRKALSVNPDVARNLSNLGLAYITKGMYEEGITQLKKAIAIDPELSSAHMNLGIAYTKQGMLHKAFNEFEHTLNIDPNYAKAHFNMAILAYKKDNPEQAIRHCDKAMELGMDIKPQFLEMLKPYRK